jgi:hypothetical protein
MMRRGKLRKRQSQSLRYTHRFRASRFRHAPSLAPFLTDFAMNGSHPESATAFAFPKARRQLRFDERAMARPQCRG